jgi:hypothetical protein
MTENKGASVQKEARPATGRSVLSRNKQLLLSMTASLALLAGLASSAEAFPFDWPSRTDLRRPDFGRQHISTARDAASGRIMVAAREKAADKAKAVAKESELASKAKGVLTIAISIDKQQLTLYSDGVPIAHSQVSTGTPGHQTPTGVFSIIQKDRWHHSNIYGNAPMYFMQRITWSGVAMHEGVVPNHPASHGCIRLPGAFARQLWGTTKLGVRVFVTHGEVTPAEIADARLFTRKPEPVDPPANVADSKPSEAPPADTPASQQSPPAVKPGDPALDAMAYARLNPRETQTPSAESVRSANLAPAPAASPAPVTKPLKPGPISVFISRREGKLFVRKGFDPVFDTPVTFDQPDRPLGTHVFTALALKDDNTLRWNVVTVPTGWTKPAGKDKKGKKVEAAPAAPPSTASEALSRVTIPADAVDRISELMSAGASLIISDQGLGPETSKGTDFIVLAR